MVAEPQRHSARNRKLHRTQQPECMKTEARNAASCTLSGSRRPEWDETPNPAARPGSAGRGHGPDRPIDFSARPGPAQEQKSARENFFAARPGPGQKFCLPGWAGKSWMGRDGPGRWAGAGRMAGPSHSGWKWVGHARGGGRVE